MKTIVRVMFAITIIAAASLPAVGQGFQADLNWEVVSELDLDAAPLDITVSADGKLLYILTPAEILLFSFAENKVTNRIAMEGFDLITAAKGGVILSSTSSKKVKFIKLESSYRFSDSNLPHLGADNAKVTVDIFNDYQCPYCKSLAAVIEQVLAKYPQEVKVVHKNFPLAMHKAARVAATAALAADRQNKYAEFHAKLYENQTALTEAKIDELAAELGLAADKFKSDMNDPALQQLISQDIQEAQLAGVRGTPTVFVNGKRLDQRNLEGFSRAIDGELAKAE